MLDAQIERERDRVLQPVGGEARGVQGGEPPGVEPFLDAGDALVVDIDVPDDVRDLLPVRVDAFVLVEEPDPRDSEVMDLLLLLGRDLAFEPDEAALGGEPFPELAGIEIGQHRGEQLDRLVDLDQFARLGKQRGRLDVGRQDLAVAIEDVRPCGRDRVLRGAAPGHVDVGRGRMHHQPRRDHRIDGREGRDGERDPRLRLSAAVGRPSIEQPIEQTLAPFVAGGFGSGLWNRRVHGLTAPPRCFRSADRRAARRRRAPRWHRPAAPDRTGGPTIGRDCRVG